MINLYPDQIELIEDIKRSIRSGNKSILVQAATGMGKTILSSSMIAGSKNKGTYSLFCVPRRLLMRQTSLTFRKYDISHTYVSSGMPYNPYSKAFIATAETLSRRLERLPKMDLVVIDEVHWGGESLNKIIQFYRKQGAIIISLSGSPVKMSGQGFDKWCDDLVCGKPIRWLIQNKRLSDYKLFIPDRPDFTGVKNQAQLERKMEEDKLLIGSAVSHYKQYAMGKLGITFTQSRKHSLDVAEQFRDAGVPAMNIDATMDEAEQSRIIKAYARRELLQLVNCQLCVFGFDLEAMAQMPVTVECMSDLQHTNSLAQQLQKNGRVLRYKDFPALIFDHSSNVMKIDGTEKHGLPCKEREWSLQGITKTKGEGKERAVKIMQCTRCYYAQKPNYERKCSNCGYVQPVQERDIKTVDGELREIKAGEVEFKKPTDRNKQRFALIAQAKRMGIKDPAGQIKFAEAVIRKQMEKRGEVSEG